MRVQKTPEGMVARFVCAGAGINPPQFLKHRIKMPTNDVRKSKGLPVSGDKEKTALAPAERTPSVWSRSLDEVRPTA
jgi:hypothetical protein